MQHPLPDRPQTVTLPSVIGRRLRLFAGDQLHPDRQAQRPNILFHTGHYTRARQERQIDRGQRPDYGPNRGNLAGVTRRARIYDEGRPITRSRISPALAAHSRAIDRHIEHGKRSLEERITDPLRHPYDFRQELRERIAKPHVLFDFSKLTHEDLRKIFKPKFDATIKHLQAFDDLFLVPEIREEIPFYWIRSVEDLQCRLIHLRDVLEDTSSVRTYEEWQRWNFSFREIAQLSFAGLRKNLRRIVRHLDDIWKANYFEFV